MFNGPCPKTILIQPRFRCSSKTISDEENTAPDDDDYSGYCVENGGPDYCSGTPAVADSCAVVLLERTC